MLEQPFVALLSAHERLMQRKRPSVTWLSGVDQSIQEGGICQAAAWMMISIRPKEYCRTVDVYAPLPDLT